jgi:dolichol-phosphate mannosyltransferase
MSGHEPDAPTLSVVVPLYDEEASVSPLVERLSRELDALGLPDGWEILLVDDGSRDRTWSRIQAAHRADPRVRGLSLSRNFGQQAALSAGLGEVRGLAVVIMDGDLQDPPEAIRLLWDRFQDGGDVVYAVRSSRPEPFWKRAAYDAFYRLLARRDRLAIPRDAGDFGIMSRRVVDRINALPERRRFLRGLRAWVGFEQVGVPIPRSPRHAGRPKYTPAKLCSLALDGLIGFGESPLRLAGGFGILAILASLATLGVFGVFLLGGGTVPPGWAWLGVGSVFLGGAQLLCVAILGEYVSRIFHEVNGRPPYLVRRRLGVGPTRSGSTGPNRQRHPRRDAPHRPLF